MIQNIASQRNPDWPYIYTWQSWAQGCGARHRSLGYALLGHMAIAPFGGAVTLSEPNDLLRCMGNMARMILLKNGMVADGSGSKLRRADILVTEDTITAVGERISLPAGVTPEVMDARGKVIAPGFIDTHSHADGGLLNAPDAETQIRQGITTAIVGQDGGSPVPLADWFRRIAERKVALNIGSFVGHGTARSRVMGADYKRPATPAEVRRMGVIVAEEMKAGAFGLSSGVEYDPGLYADTSELVALAKVASAYGGMYISHVRDEENEALASFKELIQIAREARLPAQISHIKLASAPVWGKTREVFALMDAAAREGLTISADVYPYTYWQSTITVLIPTREWDKRELWIQGLAEIGGPGNVLLTTYEPDPSWQGKTLAELASQTKQDPVSVIQEIIRKTHGDKPARESVVVTAMQERDLRAFIAHPRIMFCTDGGIRSPHPRGAGSYPRILGKYVREDRVIPLEEAIRKLTSLPASTFRLRDRGSIAPGKKADLVVFDPRTIRDTATTRSPQSQPVGLTDVLVNGVPVLRENRLTGAYPGVILKPGATKI